MADKAAIKEKSVSELITVLAEKTGLSKAQAKSFLDAHSEVLLEELKSTGSVQLAGSYALLVQPTKTMVK